MSTFIVSFPGPTWGIRGAANFRSRSRSAANPRKALGEWIGFAERLVARGAKLAILSPPIVDPPPTGILYAANYGALFQGANGPCFALARMSASHRRAETAHVRAVVESMGLPTRSVSHVWEGQAEVCTLPGNRYILTWGVRSERGSVDEIAAMLPSDAEILVIELCEPFFHGDTCLNVVRGAGGATLLLAHEGAFVDATLATLRGFCAPDVEVVPISEEDALAYACNAISFPGELVSPPGLSRELVGTLAERGVKVQEVALSELFGKGGGGPRCLVNDLGDLETSTADFLPWRAAIAAAADGYPESVRY